MKIEMNPNTRNYLVRLLENYKKELKYQKISESKRKVELQNILVAEQSLMGRKEPIQLSKPY